MQWHYALEGPSDTDFEGGVYHGKITFPKQYPFKPPVWPFAAGSVCLACWLSIKISYAAEHLHAHTEWEIYSKCRYMYEHDR